MNQVVFNGHHRRKVQRAKTLVVHLFSGDDPKFWMAQEKNGVVIICIELAKGADLRNGHLYGWLEQLARSGKIDVLLAGPPCRSVSVCRLRSLEGDVNGLAETISQKRSSSWSVMTTCFGCEHCGWQCKPMRRTRTWRSPWNNHKILNSGSNHLWTPKRRSLVGMAFQASWHGLRLR